MGEDAGRSHRSHWSNWSGGVACHPARQLMPAHEDALAQALRDARSADGAVRVVGTGHSFTPLCATDGTLVSLDAMEGMVSCEPAALRATVWAGTKLHALGAPLRAAGMALENMGDIDQQALAGAISTGTHGTGRDLGSLSTQVVGLRLLLASGEWCDCAPDREADLFAAARLALGTLGIITRVTLRLVSAYRLHARTWIAPLEECLADLPALIAAHRHCEFFWSPHDDACALKTLHPTDAETVPDAPPPSAPTERLARYLAPERVDWSDRVFPSARERRFEEMEFAVSAARGTDCLREIRHLMRTRHPDIAWPVEYRTLRADDIPLSPAYGRDSVTISIHQGAALPYQAFFADAEAVFRNHDGRPHWGKRHTYTARDLRDRYPLWHQFAAVRARVDPAGRFLTPYLRELLDA